MRIASELCRELPTSLLPPGARLRFSDHFHLPLWLSLQPSYVSPSFKQKAITRQQWRGPECQRGRGSARLLPLFPALHAPPPLPGTRTCTQGAEAPGPGPSC